MNIQNLGISIAEPKSLKLSTNGLGEIHLNNAISEIARYSLLNGFRISYGGDINYKNAKFNYTQVLYEIIKTYDNTINTSTSKKVNNYCTWYTYDKMNKDQINKLEEYIKMIKVPKPVSAKSESYNSISDIDKSRSLTAMRAYMNKEIDVRILLGGKLSGYSGRYPGLLEECYLALKDSKPIYLIGGFGGCTEKIIELLKGEKPVEFTEDYQTKENDNYKKLITKYFEFNKSTNSKSDENSINYQSMCSYFQQKGIKNLNNGLNNEENEVLFFSKNLSEIIFILMKGLKAITKKK